MSVTKKDCINLLQQRGASGLEATQTVDALLEQKKNLGAAGKSRCRRGSGGRGESQEKKGLDQGETDP